MEVKINFGVYFIKMRYVSCTTILMCSVFLFFYFFFKNAGHINIVVQLLCGFAIDRYHL
jgi:hypothetical protein